MARMEEIAQRSMPYPPAMALPMPMFRNPAKPIKPEIAEDNISETVITPKILLTHKSIEIFVSV